MCIRDRVYAALTLLFYPLSFGLSQLRISEGLCILPYFTPAAVPGLFLGCVIANIFGGFGLLDKMCIRDRQETVDVTVAAGQQYHKNITADSILVVADLSDISAKGTYEIKLQTSVMTINASIKRVTTTTVQVKVDDLVQMCIRDSVIADALDLAILHFPVMNENAGRAADKRAHAPAFEAEKGEKIVEQNEGRRRNQAIK